MRALARVGRKTSVRLTVTGKEAISIVVGEHRRCGSLARRGLAMLRRYGRI